MRLLKIVFGSILIGILACASMLFLLQIISPKMSIDTAYYYVFYAFVSGLIGGFFVTIRYFKK
jgi:hypothetical protein